jgi:hypothetical protein
MVPEPMRQPVLALFAPVLLVSLACSGTGDGSDTGTSNSDSATETGSDSSATTDPSTTDPSGGTSAGSTTGVTTTGVSTSGPGSDSDPSGGTMSFVQDPDTPDGNECDPKLQDCPDGEKCAAWANDGGSSWNANKCVPVSGNGQHGDECMTEGGGLSGLDSCGVGAMCYGTDENGVGVCVSFCDANDMCPVGSQCTISNDGVLPICKIGCDPLLQDCPDGMGCYAVDGAEGDTVCMTDSSGAGGLDGEPCEYDNVCDPGLVCIGGSAGCNTTWCCTPWCDMSQANTCPGAGEECIAHYQAPPPGAEDLGICVVP